MPGPGGAQVIPTGGSDLARKLLFALALLALVVGTFAGMNARDAIAQDGPTVTINAGNGEVGYSINQFLPKSARVVEGTTVDFVFPWYELHIVAFLAEGAPPPAGPPPVSPSGVSWPNSQGAISSGEIFGNPDNPPVFSVKFPTAGVFQYFCPIHPMMTGTIEVVAAGTPGIDPQVTLDARAKAEYNSSIITIKETAAGLKAAPAQVSVVGGKSTHTVVTGAESLYGDDAMQFFPAAITIKEGDAVRWKANALAPHPLVINPQNLPDGFDPFGPGVGGSTFAGSGAWASPVLSTMPAEFGPAAVTEFSLTFTKAGTYTYMCILHADQGMVGTVTVAAKPTAPAPPNTGSGTVAADDRATPGGWLLVLGAVVIAAGLGRATVAVVRRR